MSNFYYYNSNLDEKGKHEVHTEGCNHLPTLSNRILIGYEQNCKAAIQRAKKETGKSNFDGCFFCCNECHIG